MRGREFEQDIIDDSEQIEGQVEEGVRRILGSSVAFHHTVKEGYHTHGGLHETHEGAEEARQEMVGKTGLPEKVWAGKAKIIDMAEGIKYNPWRSLNMYTHGVDDGTHGSEKVK